MNFYIIPAALVLTLFIIALFALALKKPLRGFSLFFLIVFLITWTGQLWITPFGPVAWGIAWIPLIFICLLFSFLILALSSTVTPRKARNTDKEDAPVIAAGVFFWLLLVVLIISIGLGYYKEYQS